MSIPVLSGVDHLTSATEAVLLAVLMDHIPRKFIDSVTVQHNQSETGLVRHVVVKFTNGVVISRPLQTLFDSEFLTQCLLVYHLPP